MGTIDLNLLSLFVAVANASSFSGAARKLGVPKSSVSRGISALESSMGIRLLHRTTRHVSLSTAGAALYERASPLLASLERSVGDLPELEEQPSGEVRVTAPIDFGSTILAEIVARFAARYPSVRIDLRLSNAVVDLVKEGFDLAFRMSSRPLEDSSLVARRASPLVLQLFAGPTYLARRGTPRSPSDLRSHDWVVFRGPSSLRMEGPNGSSSIRVDGRIACDDMLFVRESLRAGAGVGLLPRFLAEDDVIGGRLVQVLPRWTLRGGHLWIVYPHARHVPRKVAAFRDFALESMRVRPLGARVS